MYSRSKSKKKERKKFGLVWIFQSLPHGSILHQKDVSVDCATHSNVACIFSYRGTSASRHQTHMGSTSNGHSYFLCCQLGGSTPPPLVGNRSKFCALLHWQPSLSSGQVVCTIAFVHSVIHSGAAFFSRMAILKAVCTMAHMWKAYCSEEVAEKEVKSRAWIRPVYMPAAGMQRGMMWPRLPWKFYLRL